MTDNMEQIDLALRSAFPCSGISIGKRDDKSTWLVHFTQEVAADVEAAALSMLRGLDIVEVEVSPDPILARIAKLEADVAVIKK